MINEATEGINNKGVTWDQFWKILNGDNKK